MVFCDFSLTRYNIFKVHPCCIIYQCFTPLYCGTIFHWLDRPCFIYPLISLWTCGLSPHFHCFFPFSSNSRHLFDNPYSYGEVAPTTGSRGMACYSFKTINIFILLGHEYEHKTQAKPIFNILLGILEKRDILFVGGHRLRWYRIHLQCRGSRFKPWIRKTPWRRKWQPIPVFLSWKIP